MAGAESRTVPEPRPQRRLGARICRILHQAVQPPQTRPAPRSPSPILALHLSFSMRSPRTQSVGQASVRPVHQRVHHPG
jgi:hypothetical protein